MKMIKLSVSVNVRGNHTRAHVSLWKYREFGHIGKVIGHIVKKYNKWNKSFLSIKSGILLSISKTVCK